MKIQDQDGWCRGRKISSSQHRRYPRERSMRKAFLRAVGLVRRASSSFIRRMHPTQKSVLNTKLAFKCGYITFRNPDAHIIYQM